MAAALSSDDWTDSSEDDDEYQNTALVSSEDELGVDRRVVGGMKTVVKMNDSACQTELTGRVVYRHCYVGRSVTHHTGTFKVDRRTSAEDKPRGCMMLEVECQTKSTGMVRTKEECDRLRLLPAPFPRSAEGRGSPRTTGNVDESRRRSTLVSLITNAIPTLTGEMLTALSGVVFNMVEGQTDWEAIEAQFGIDCVDTREVGVDAREVGVNTRDVGVNTRKVTVNTRDVGVNTARGASVDRGVQAGVRMGVANKATQAAVKMADKHTMVEAEKCVEREPVRCVDAQVQTEVVTGAEKETQTMSTFVQNLCWMFHVSPLGLFILILSSIHVLEVIKNMMFG